jgi:nucleoside 2-deoxyribosyltransferase
MSLNIYLAGPDVFLPDARDIGRRKQSLCRAHGFNGLYPLDADDSSGDDAALIFKANCALMRQADIGLCNLTPFRGPSADAGTLVEVGFLFALGKPVYGYTTTALNYRDRVEKDGYGVEDFGLFDNLMIARAIIESGGAVTMLAEPPDSFKPPLAAFAAFAASLRLIAAKA